MPFLVIVILVIAAIVARKIYLSKKEAIIYQPNRFSCFGTVPPIAIVHADLLIRSIIVENGGPNDFKQTDTPKSIKDIVHKWWAYVYESSNGDKMVLVHQILKYTTMPDGSKGDTNIISFGIHPKDTLASWKTPAEEEAKTKIRELLSSNNIQLKN
jgi:hypothetical protein